MTMPYIDDELYQQIKKERYYFIRFKDFDFWYIPTQIVLMLIKLGIKYDFNFDTCRFIIK